MNSVWLELPVGPFRLTTAITALVLAGWMLWRSRSVLVALAAVLGWLAAYEVVYIWTGTVVHHWSLGAAVWTTSLVGWVVVSWLVGIRPAPWLLLLFVVGWIWWIAIGFAANSPGYPWRWPDEVLNVATKTVLAVAFALGFRRVSAPQRTVPVASSPSPRTEPT